MRPNKREAQQQARGVKQGASEKWGVHLRNIVWFHFGSRCWACCLSFCFVSVLLGVCCSFSFLISEVSFNCCFLTFAFGFSFKLCLLFCSCLSLLLVLFVAFASCLFDYCCFCSWCLFFAVFSSLFLLNRCFQFPFVWASLFFFANLFLSSLFCWCGFSIK